MGDTEVAPAGFEPGADLTGPGRQELMGAKRAPQSFCFAALFLAMSACGPSGGEPGQESDAPAGAVSSLEPAASTVRPGIEVLLTDSLHLVRGRRAGLITGTAC